MPVEAEADEDEDADKAERESDEKAELSGSVLGLDGGGESPLAEEIPNADAEMEGAGEDANQSEGEEPGIHEEVLDFFVGGTPVGGPALRVEMPGDVNESEEAGVALRGVEPVPYPGIGGYVGFAAQPDVDAVEGVEKHREKNGGPFDERTEGDGLQIVRNLVVFGAGDKNGTIGPEMFGEESAYRNDAG